MKAGQFADAAFDVPEHRVPDQRAVTEHPERPRRGMFSERALQGGVEFVVGEHGEIRMGTAQLVPQGVVFEVGAGEGHASF